MPVRTEWLLVGAGVGVLILCVIILIVTKKKRVVVQLSTSGPSTQSPSQTPTGTPWTQMPTTSPTNMPTDWPTTGEPIDDVIDDVTEMPEITKVAKLRIAEEPTDFPSDDQPTDFPSDDQPTDFPSDDDQAFDELVSDVTLVPKLRLARKAVAPDTVTLGSEFEFTNDSPVLVALSPSSSPRKRLMLESNANGFDVALGPSRANSLETALDEIWALVPAGAGAIFVRSAQHHGLYLAGDARCNQVSISSSPYAWDANFDGDKVSLSSAQCSSKYLTFDTSILLRGRPFKWTIQKVIHKKSTHW